jgi:pyruvate dehydrogenase E2 component (dihydrolipoamide acetyltransferase)
VQRLRDAGQEVTLTHLVGRALAHAFEQVPDLNVRLVGGRMVPRPSVDVFFITAVGGGRDLSGVKVLRANEKSAAEISLELASRARLLKQGRDPGFRRTKRLMERVPVFLLRPLLRLVGWVVGKHGRAVPPLKLEASPFGSVMVSSVGMFGLPNGYSPIAWIYNVPVLALVGELTKKPLAVEGRVEIRPVLPICVTLDHRYVDGWHISQMARHFRAYLDDPAAFEPTLRSEERVPVEVPLPAPH